MIMLQLIFHPKCQVLQSNSLHLTSEILFPRFMRVESVISDNGVTRGIQRVGVPRMHGDLHAIRGQKRLTTITLANMCVNANLYCVLGKVGRFINCVLQ